MANWRTLEVLYGRSYMVLLRRRIILTTLIAFALGVVVGWWARG